MIDPYGLQCLTEQGMSSMIALMMAYLLYEYLKNLDIDWYIDWDKTDDQGGAYFRHYTSKEGMLGILGSGQIFMSTGKHLEYGPGVYFTTPRFSPKDVRVTGSRGNYYVDVWVPRSTSSKGPPVWNNHGGGQYTYGGGNYPIFNDPEHPPLPGNI